MLIKPRQCVVLCVVVLAIGCNKGGQPVAENSSTSASSGSNAEARKLVESCKTSYRNAQTYTDRAYVRLAYRVDGTLHEDRAPLAVSYESRNRISVNAYALRLVSDGETMLATVSDPLTNNLDGQCLVKSVTSPLSLELLYEDPLVAQAAGAGLGGVAPQLELLLADNPLQAWLGDETKLLMGETGSVQDHECQQIITSVGELRYSIWIDQKNRLVRRIVLPWRAIAPGLAGDPRLSEVSLTIECADARINGPISSRCFAVEMPPMTRSVSSLVMPPPIAPHPLVGNPTKRFQLRDTSGRFQVSEKGSDRDATVLLWVADHLTSRGAAQVIHRLMESLPEKVSKRTQSMVVMAEPGGSTDQMLRAWGVGLPWVDDQKAVGQDVFGISEAPCLVVVGHDGLVELYENRVTTELFDAMPEILEKIVLREPVGKVVQERYVETRARYIRALAATNLEMPFSTASSSLSASVSLEKRFR